MKRVLLAIALVMISVQTAAPSLSADDAAEVKKIKGLIEDKKEADAEEALQAALKEFPDSSALKGLHMPLYVALARAGKLPEAAAHATAHLDYQLERFDEDPLTAEALVNAANMVAFALQRAGKGDLAVANVDRAIAAVEKKQADKPEPELAGVVNDLRSGKITLLLRDDKTADAEKLLKTELAAATKNLESQPDDPDAAVRLANMLRMEINVVSQTAPDKVAPLNTKLLDFLTNRVQKHPTNAPLVGAYINNSVQAISGLMSSDPDEAEKLLKAFDAFMVTLDRKSRQIKSLVDRAEQTSVALERNLAAERQRFALIGKPAFPLDVEAWVNGDPISDGDLKGKVVLLDFWAVWCGPCIATFPHLREWNEKYGNKGLVIIGVTKYYQYDWDDDGQKIKRTEGLTPELEQAAMLKFAAHHKLSHRLAVTPTKTEFHKDYTVSGIPQAVLIDQSGAIRMIRVGSGDKNAHDLEGMIKKLLGEPVTPDKTAAGK